MAKALGTGFRNKIFFKDIEIMNTFNGTPYIICSERVLKFLKKINNKIDNSKIHLSISDEKKYSIALVSILYL